MTLSAGISFKTVSKKKKKDMVCSDLTMKFPYKFSRIEYIYLAEIFGVSTAVFHVVWLRFPLL